MVGMVSRGRSGGKGNDTCVQEPHGEALHAGQRRQEMNAARQGKDARCDAVGRQGGAHQAVTGDFIDESAADYRAQEIADGTRGEQKSQVVNCRARLDAERNHDGAERRNNKTNAEECNEVRDGDADHQTALHAASFFTAKAELALF